MGLICHPGTMGSSDQLLILAQNNGFQKGLRILDYGIYSSKAGHLLLLSSLSCQELRLDRFAGWESDSLQLYLSLTAIKIPDR